MMNSPHYHLPQDEALDGDALNTEAQDAKHNAGRKTELANGRVFALGLGGCLSAACVIGLVVMFIMESVR